MHEHWEAKQFYEKTVQQILHENFNMKSVLKDGTEKI